MPEARILRERERAKKIVKDRYPGENLILSSLWVPREPPRTTINELWCMAKALEFMAVVDLVFFTRSWAKASDCLIMHLAASVYKVPIVYEEQEN